MKHKIALLILLFVFVSGCTAPVTIHDNGTIMMHGKQMSVENKTLEGWDSSYSQIIFDNTTKEFFPMEFEVDVCGDLERELDRHGQNVTYGNFALTVTETKIIKWELNETGNWSKRCEINLII